MNGTDIVIEARKWIGTPFRHQGHTRGRGVDCLGLVYGVARDLGLTQTTLPAYPPEPSGNTLVDALDRHLDRVPNSQARAGDVLVFRFARFAQHLAVFTGNGMIHSYQGVGNAVEHSYCGKWRRRHILTYRFRGIE